MMIHVFCHHWWDDCDGSRLKDVGLHMRFQQPSVVLPHHRDRLNNRPAGVRCEQWQARAAGTKRAHHP